MARSNHHHRGFSISTVVIVVLAVVLAVVVLMWKPWATITTTPPPPPADTPPPATTPVDFDAAAASWYGESSAGDERVSQVADGLWQCASRTENVGAAAVVGFEYKMPRTLEGAVAAAAQKARLLSSTELWTTTTRAQIMELMPGWAPDTDQEAADAAEQAMANGLDPDTGAAVDPATGVVVPDGEVWAGAYPRYGAYKVWWVAYQAGHQPQAVEMTWLMPSLWGTKVGTDTSGIKMGYVSYSFLVWWSPELGDWMPNVYQDTTPPAPTVVNPGYATLAEVTQHQDWCVPADATEAAIPGARLTKS